LPSARWARNFVRLIDAYSVKPIDVATLSAAARDTRQMLVVEDHAVDGGLGDAVSAAVGSTPPVYRLAVAQLPRSGTKDELLDRCGISRRSIVEKVMQLAA
jgi:transketolase